MRYMPKTRVMSEQRHAAAELEHLGACSLCGLNDLLIVTLLQQELLPLLAAVGGGDVDERRGDDIRRLLMRERAAIHRDRD